MVAVFNKELLSWYLITLKLRESVEDGIRRSNPNSPSTSQPRCLDLPQIQEVSDDVLREPPPEPESQWVISIREKIDLARKEESACPWAKLSIYHVPKTLREGDEEAYLPQYVSIGPFHLGKRRLREMDKHKWRSLQQVLRRTGHDVRLYLDAIRSVEEKARECYEGEISLSSDEFVECLVLDSCFVLEIFRGAAGEGFKELGYSRYDPVFAMRGTMHAVQRDMIMLENQIPLFVLERILALQLGLPADHRGLVVPLTLRFFDPLMPTDEPLKKEERVKIESTHATRSVVFDPLTEDGLHCLDVFRQSLLRRGPQQTPRVWKKRWSRTTRIADRRRQQFVHCVSELRNAGIKFRRHNTDRLWDIKFENGILKIPRLLIHDGTKSLFLNLIAFEQCQMDISNNITSYVIFMDNIINSGEDVRHLHYRGIIEHWLGNDDEVADLFNKLCQEVVFDINDSYLSVLSEQMNQYYHYRWNAWRASLKHNYFSNPWAIISLIAAIVLLLFTSAQTYYGILGYYNPSN